MGYSKADHTFVVCAYKESQYLEECIRSLKAQTLKTNIIISTSTPNNYIKNIADKYDINVYINNGKTGIAEDWNYGLSQVETHLATVAHQDDLYTSDYVEHMLKHINNSVHPLIFFTDYAEIRKGKKVEKNQLLRIKRSMLFPLRWRPFQKSRFIRRRILSIGCPIGCPSVTFVRPNLPTQIFQSQYLSCVDWQAWEKISRLKGNFVYCPKTLNYHRIHEGSATTKILRNNDRYEEDYQMFCIFWPKWIAKILAEFYSKSADSNDL